VSRGVAEATASAQYESPSRGAHPQRIIQLLRGPAENPAWQRAAVIALLTFTALLYTWGLDRNGWANSFYSAAAMSGSLDWTAFLFGSSDPGNAITVDKPPLSIWIMSLSVRMFGLSSWSLLLPQSVMGVLSVYLLYRIVQKHFGPATGLLAGTFFAVTPVATVIFRYNNPDALLTLLLIGIAFFTLESIDRGQLRWLLLAGVLTGAAFLTKQLQMLLIAPSVAVSYSAFARTSMFKRFLHLAETLAVAVMSAGWWLLTVQLTDPSNRPFIGGSRDNSVAELTLGYNGLDRLTGEGANSAIVGEVGKGTEKLDVGFQRFLQPDFSGQFGWFLPLAIAGLFVSFWFLWRRKGDKTARALLLFCCVWFSCAVTVVAYMSGIVHPYYVLTAVPPLCCLAAVALMHFLRSLQRRRIRLVAGVTLAGSMFFAYISAVRSTEDFPGFPQVLLVVWGLVIGAVLVWPPRPVIAQLTTGVLLGALFLGPVVWSINTVLSPHIGAGVIAGPDLLGLRSDDRDHAPPDVLTGLVSVMYGELPSTAQLQRLHATPTSATWVSAVVGSETAANYQLETRRAVLPIGGFDGKDPFPTLEQFKILVDQGRVGSVLIQRLPPWTLEGRGESAKIVDWVRANFTAEKIDGADYFPLIK
jgi:4-amino-4-deoxy-L-arabinose transferase-like glycosyltransferase